MRLVCMSPCLLARLRVETGSRAQESPEAVVDCKQKCGYGVMQPKSLKAWW